MTDLVQQKLVRRASTLLRCGGRHLRTSTKWACQDPLTFQVGNLSKVPVETSNFWVHMEPGIKSTWRTEHHRLPTRPPAENCVRLNLVTQSVIHKPKGRAVKIFILIWLPNKCSWETLLRSVSVNVLLTVRRSNHSRFRWYFGSARADSYRVTWNKVQNMFNVWRSKKLAFSILTLLLPSHFQHRLRHPLYFYISTNGWLPRQWNISF